MTAGPSLRAELRDYRPPLLRLLLRLPLFRLLLLRLPPLLFRLLPPLRLLLFRLLLFRLLDFLEVAMIASPVLE